MATAMQVSQGGEGGGGGKMEAKDKEVFELDKGCEIRIEWSSGSVEPSTSSATTTETKSCTLKLIRGTAEVFGTELALGQTVDVYGQNVSCLTFHGAAVELEKDKGSSGPFVYTVGADETPATQYMNAHAVLQKKRDEGRSGSGIGPRCLIAGPVDAGKSTLARILTNYAVRAGNTPVLVDLDVGQPMITVPGAVSCMLVEDVADVKTGSFPGDNVLSFFYGHASPSENVDHYKTSVERLAVILDTFLSSKTNALASSSGVFVNTMGWVDGMGYDLLLHAIDKLKIETVLVIGHVRLFSQLRKTFPFTEKDPEKAKAKPKDARRVEVVKMAKSSGVVARDSVYRKNTREGKIRSYFYGPSRELSPFSRSVQTSQVHVFRVGGGLQVPLSALPIGTAARGAEDKMKVVKVNVQRDLTHSLLGVTHAKAPEDILHTNLAGFIHVTEVDVHKGIITYLSPSPSHLPSPILVAGSVKCFL